MADGQRTLTANFTADTSGFSPKVNELIQKLKTLNQDFEQNKSKVRELSAQLKEYEKELKQLNQMYPHITCLKALAYMPKNPIPNTTHI